MAELQSPMAKRVGQPRNMFTPTFAQTEKPRHTSKGRSKNTGQRKVRTPVTKVKDLPQIEEATFLVSSVKLQQLMEPCTSKGGKCRGNRQIINQSCQGNGGCVEFIIECTVCADQVVWQSGTEFLGTKGDFRSRRYAEATLLHIGCLLGGVSEAGYNEVCAASGINGFAHGTLYQYGDKYFKAAETLMQESCATARQIFKVSDHFKTLGEFVGLYDGAWMHRGYASHHGSGAMVDTFSGMIIFLGHLSKDKSQFEKIKWLHSSSAMETEILQRILKEAETLGIKFKIIVGDADASTQKVVNESGAKCGRCCNHGGKNLGNQAIKCGKITSCNCPVKRNADGTPSKLKTKVHKAITVDVAKKMQKSFGAATMEAGTDKALWLLRIKQIANHYQGLHLLYSESELESELGDPWVVLDIDNFCHAHDLVVKTTEGDGLVEKKSTLCDCPAQFDALREYMDDHLLCDVDEFITDCGGVRTNLVETIWKAFLKYRSKDQNIGGDQFMMLSNLACAAFNQPLIQQHPGHENACFQQRFCDLLGVPVPAQTKRKWDKMNSNRSKQSKTRRTEIYKVKQANLKKKRRVAKADDKAQREAELKAMKAANKQLGTYISGGDAGASARYGVVAGGDKGKGKKKAAPKAPSKKKRKAPVVRTCSREGCEYTPAPRKRICSYCSDM